ncbi:hypothetical protein BH11PLA2_BH11PLA2_44040 [soil metagenome]
MKTPKKVEKFPLWLHPGGQWCRKHQGSFYYFGQDKETALKRYVEEWDDLKAGRKRRTPPGELTLADCCNHFLTAKQERLVTGDITSRTWDDYKSSCESVIAELGRGRTVADLRSEDFAKLRNAMAKKYGPVSLSNRIQRVRTLFKHAFDAELIDVPIRFGPGFAKPSRRVIRLKRADKAVRIIEAPNIRKLIAAAGSPMDAMILLAINAGFGQTDCSELPATALTREGWLDFRRPKTGAPRRVPLWPETLKALEKAIAARPDPIDPADDRLVFITRFGRPFIRYSISKTGRSGTRCDSIAQSFTKLAKSVGLEDLGGFYNLRHTHRTVSDGARDQVAAALIMGHVDDTIAGAYRERIEDERLLAVVNVVREWLFK